MDSDKLLNLATSLGCLLAESGAEISRVEESVYRLLQAYQGKDAQVFAIPSCLIVSLMAEDGRPVTRMRRRGWATSASSDCTWGRRGSWCWRSVLW